jgi:alkaline phosphatase
MTEKAIELLSKNNKGFFLMVEGSQVDWAGHANDAAYMVYDFLVFDEAVGKALDFAKEDGHTLVLIFPDHNTGGLTIGHEMSDFPPGYTATKIEDLIDPIKDAKMTIQQLLYEIPSPATAQGVINTFAEYHGDYWEENMTMDQAQYVADTLNASDPYGAYYPIAEYVSKNLTIFGWTTHGHNGEDVPLWAYGPNRPVGTLDNTELATLVADAFNFSLKDMTTRLFFDVSKEDGYKLDTKDPENPVIKYYNAEFPVGKNIMRVGSSEFLLEGIVVYAPETKRAYVPLEALKILVWY